MCSPAPRRIVPGTGGPLRTLDKTPFSLYLCKQDLQDCRRAALSLSPPGVLSAFSMCAHGQNKQGKTGNFQVINMETLYTILLGAAVIVAIYVLIKIIAAPIKKIFKLLLNAVCGLLLLFIANFIGGFFNFAIPVNLLTCIIAGAFGIPGVIFLGVVVLFMG